MRGQPRKHFRACRPIRLPEQAGPCRKDTALSIADGGLSPTRAAYLLNTQHAAGGVSVDQVRRLAARGAIPAELVGNRLRFDEKRLPEIATTIRRLLPTARRLPRPAA